MLRSPIPTYATDVADVTDFADVADVCMLRVPMHSMVGMVCRDPRRKEPDFVDVLLAKWSHAILTLRACS